MKLLLFILSMICLTGCVVITPNGCMLDAVQFQAKKDMESSGVWSKVIIVEWYHDDIKSYTYHAWCIYEYPKHEGRAWAYDASGSRFVWVPKDVKECTAEEIAKSLQPGFYGAFFVGDEGQKL